MNIEVYALTSLVFFGGFSLRGDIYFYILDLLEITLQNHLPESNCGAGNLPL